MRARATHTYVAGTLRHPALSDWQAVRRRQNLVPLVAEGSESVPVSKYVGSKRSIKDA